MELPDKGGVTMREKLEQVAATTGKHPEALDRDPIPQPSDLAFSLWMDLNTGRAQNGWGAAPLTWQDLDSWSRMRGIKPTWSQLELIRTIDNAYLKATAEKSKEGEQ